MSLVHLPALRKKSLETLSHTALSVAHLRRHPVDVAIVFNSANAPFVPLLRAQGIPVATHVDGLEWQRSKWQGAGQPLLPQRRVDGRALVRRPDRRRPGHRRLLPHGVRRRHRAHRLRRPDHRPAGADKLAELGVESGRFHLVVARFEPENHVDVIVDGYRRSFADLPLVVVGSAPYADEHTAAHPLPRRRAGALHRRRLGPGPARPALRPLRDLPARALGRRHEPVAAARHRCRGGRHRLRRELQPRGPARQRSLLPHRRRRRPTRSSSPRQHPEQTAHARSRWRASWPTATTGTTSPPATSRCASRWSSPARVRVSARPTGRRRGIDSLNPVVRLDDLYVAERHGAVGAARQQARRAG